MGDPPIRHFPFFFSFFFFSFSYYDFVFSALNEGASDLSVCFINSETITPSLTGTYLCFFLFNSFSIYMHLFSFSLVRFCDDCVSGSDSIGGFSFLFYEGGKEIWRGGFVFWVLGLGY